MISRREVQGTVAAFDPSDHHGRVLLDDGIELTFRREALTGSGIRLLRVGQRVRLVLDGGAGDQFVRAVTIITFPSAS